MGVRIFRAQFALIVFASIAVSIVAWADLRDCLPVRLQGGPYLNRAMRHYHWAEDKRLRVHYMNANELKSHRIIFENGKPFKSGDSKLDPIAENDRMMYVMDEHGRFYFASAGKHLKHSSFFAGKPVAAAGNIEFKNGRLEHIDMGSGHYKPRDEHFRSAIAMLVMEGVDISQATLSFEGNSAVKGALSIETPAAYVFSEMGSLSCIERSIRKSAVKTAQDLATFYSASPKKFHSFLADLEKTGKLHEYDSALRLLTQESEKFLQVLPEKVQHAMEHGYSTHNRFPCTPRFFRNLFR